MCLQTKWKNPKIAKRAILVYKLLHKDRKSIYVGQFEYELNKTYTTEMKISKDTEHFDDAAYEWIQKVGRSNVMSISEGFHAFTSIERAERIGHCVFSAIIPKGAKYYKDGTGLIVSSKIKVGEQL